MCWPGEVTGKQPVPGLLHSPPILQDVQQLGGEHDIAIFLPLALLDTDDHTLAIDIGGFQADSLGDTQAGGVAGGQDRAMLGARNAAQELERFLRTENDR